MRLLLVEDDPALGPSLKVRLERQRYAVDLVADGADGLAAALAVPYDALIVDVLLPTLSGFDLCRNLRAQHMLAPILLLTALSEVEQRITGLDAGADDYLCKPFAMGELEARVRALLRRQASEKTAVLRFADLALDTRTHEVWRGDQLFRSRPRNTPYWRSSCAIHDRCSHDRCSSIMCGTSRLSISPTCSKPSLHICAANCARMVSKISLSPCAGLGTASGSPSPHDQRLTGACSTY